MSDTDTTKTKADVEAELRGSSEAIQGRLDAIQDEIATTGHSVRTFLREHPLASVGGSLLAGALVGWLVAGMGRRRLSKAHRQLLHDYIEALRDEVRDAVADGEEVGRALQEALRNRAPLIVYGQPADTGGWLRQAVGVVADTAFALIVREVLSGLIDGIALEDRAAADGSGADDGAAGALDGGESSSS